jgi:hypothetical protein
VFDAILILAGFIDHFLQLDASPDIHIKKIEVRLAHDPSILCSYRAAQQKFPLMSSFLPASFIPTSMPATTGFSSRRLTIDEQMVRIDILARSYRPPNHVEVSNFYVPETQREWSWKSAKQSLFIDSIMLNYPIPSIICNIDEQGRHAIYDGRHRVETLWRFFNDEVRWGGRKFRELTDFEKYQFLERKLTIVTTYHATDTELADIFERLNSGARLTDSDLFWNRRATPLMSITLQKFLKSGELGTLWGGIDLGNRKHLSNYVGIVAGLVTADPNNFTTSYIRLGGNALLLENIDTDIAERRITEGMHALVDLYTRANSTYPVTTKNKLKPYSKLGNINAFFLTEWITAAVSDREQVIAKWSDIIGKLRDPDTRNDMRLALSTKGAQNLTTVKINIVLRQIDNYLNGGQIDNAECLEMLQAGENSDEASED